MSGAHGLLPETADRSGRVYLRVQKAQVDARSGGIRGEKRRSRGRGFAYGDDARAGAKRQKRPYTVVLPLRR